MNITIAGYGFVGQAHYALLKKDHTVSIYDPPLGYTEWPEHPDAVIVCVSTPGNPDGSCNMNNVIDVVRQVPEETPILIKSTISLQVWNYLTETFPENKIAFSPEFLRAQTAITDFLNCRKIYVGGAETSFWHVLFRTAFDDDTFSTVSVNASDLILAKYFRNSFLATKVSFFNQIYDLCKVTGQDYETVASVVGADERIGTGHTAITKQRGYGGHCFPKDVDAILHTANQYNTSLSLINESKEYNQKTRRK
jgi:UDPglucose 6-dehydrogenase